MLWSSSTRSPLNGPQEACGCRSKPQRDDISHIDAFCRHANVESLRSKKASQGTSPREKNRQSSVGATNKFSRVEQALSHRGKRPSPSGVRRIEKMNAQSQGELERQKGSGCECACGNECIREHAKVKLNMDVDIGVDLGVGDANADPDSNARENVDVDVDVNLDVDVAKSLRPPCSGMSVTFQIRSWSQAGFTIPRDGAVHVK
mmetsp:Transcript_24866/g.65348  ORF Transcript_24866/g.65348 Transcript_24866/m.65348 type:complete len:204 (-) Transcript_24866:12-623(-)